MASKPAAITSLEDFDESINLLIYGDSGIGKTVLSGTAPGKSLFISTETGTISAKRQGSKAEIWRCPAWDDLVAAYEYLRDEDHGYDWVMLDSITEMQTHALTKILAAAAAENENRDPDIPAIQDYQKWQNMFKRFVRAFNDLPVNVLYTALTFRSDDEEGEPLVLPLITGKGYQMAQWTCAQMHMVGYYSIQNVKKAGSDVPVEVRRLRVQPTPPYFAKDRYDVGKRFLDNPTLARIARLIDQTPEQRAAESLPAVVPTKAPAKATASATSPAKASPAKVTTPASKENT